MFLLYLIPKRMGDFKCLRIVNLDFYMSQPNEKFDVAYTQFRGSAISQVPVIRIFGSTDEGKKMCLHVHGTFPYFYIPFDGSGDLNALKYKIASSIDKAINITFGQMNSTCQHVYKIQLVTGIPLYGYHSNEHQFLKIFLYNPRLVPRASQIVQREDILNNVYQSHESHIPYTLQFMIDFNLHGMSKIRVSEIELRDDSSKSTYCELEGDCLAENILNRLEISSGKIGINPGISALWEDEKQRRRLKHDDSEIGPCLTLIKTQNTPTRSHVIFKEALSQRLALSNSSLDESSLEATLINKGVKKSSLNSSVYPAEIATNPDGIGNILSASFVDFHSPKLSLSLTSNESDLDATLDDDAKMLYELIQLENQRVDLDQEPDNKDYIEDSILSQFVKDDDEDQDDDHDLSISMPDSTPVKLIPDPDQQNLDLMVDNDSDALKVDNDSDDDIFDTTLVPQLDGAFTSSSDEERQSQTIRKKKKPSKNNNKYQVLPISVVQSTSKNDNSLVDKAKRKLSFQQGSEFETTQIEEYVECQLKGEPAEVSLIKNFEKSPFKDQIIRDYFYEDSKLTKAEKYDIETNYRAKAGCSIVTRSSQDSNKLSSSDEIPPYQPVIDNQMSPNPEEVPPYQLVNEVTSGNVFITPVLKPPTRAGVINSLESYKIAQTRHQKPFYSKPDDVTGPVEVGYSVLKIPSKTTAHVDEFKSTITNGIEHCRKLFYDVDCDRVNKLTKSVKKSTKLSFCPNSNCVITPLHRPPTSKSVAKWLLKRGDAQNLSTRSNVAKSKIHIKINTSQGDDDQSDLDLSLTLTPQQATASQQENSCRITGFKRDHSISVSGENYQHAKSIHEKQYLTVLSMEIHTRTRADFKPDPQCDSIRAIFYSILEDGDETKTGFLAVNSIPVSPTTRKFSLMEGVSIRCDHDNIEIFGSEEDMVQGFVQLIRKLDPDLLVGYEIEMLSWGYLIGRCDVLGINLAKELSRLRDDKGANLKHDLGLTITGRVILDVWRLMRHEISLQSYNFESIVFNILHRRVPLHSFKDLSLWWDHRPSKFRHRTIDYYLMKTRTVLQLLDQLDLIGRTSELARLFGIQFYEVLSRGSQFRVESMMLRSAKPLNFIPVSPSVNQRAKMKAPEFLPLILEPESKLYVDPVIVLDFQSLYPSIMIAYNYCYSTCIGRVSHLGSNVPFEFGATQLRVPRRTVERLLALDALNFSPSGVGFVRGTIRDGIMPRMLREILDTRLMVKKSMKENKSNKTLQKVLHSRQLGLKLIANVTYGYTNANFTGRMPAVELADSILSKARETLQRAINAVENTPEWEAKVVYGDTDSLFVVVPNKSREEAFKVGQMIADYVTNDNPDPVKLKLEKVYHPCILQTKKRYVGYMYESPEQEEAIYDAKGIETVRRDGCPAVSKMLEKSLRVLFETKDVTLVKQYVLRQFYKIFAGRVSLQDLTFAKEYRGAKHYRPGACVPALELAKKWTAIDRRNEPRSGERVPYIIANGPPGLPLIRLVHSPWDFLNDSSLRPNALYYITKVIIPPINRCFKLIGADVNYWFSQMPRKQFQYLPSSTPGKVAKTISQYFLSTSCVSCGQQTQKGMCEDCLRKEQETGVVLFERIRRWENSYQDTSVICRSCCDIYGPCCISLDCPVLYKLYQSKRDVGQADYVRKVISDNF